MTAQQKRAVLQKAYGDVDAAFRNAHSHCFA